MHPLRIGLSRHGLAVVAQRRGLRANAGVLTEWPCGAAGQAKLLPTLRKTLGDGAFKQKTAVVVLADEMIRLFMVRPPINARSVNDLQIAADLRFQSLYGEAPDAWIVQGEWDATHRFLACAVRREFQAELDSICREASIRIVEFQPHFVAAWNYWRQRIATGEWFGVVHGEMLTLGPLGKHGFLDIRQVQFSPEAALDQGWLRHLVSRESLRMETAPVTRVQLCGDVPDAWLDDSESAPVVVKLDPCQPGCLSGSGSATGLLCSTGEKTWQ